ncbi:MAG: hypothetical protein ACJASF_001556 [Vicingaceae bacterium]
MQTFAAQKAAKYLSSKLNVPVTLSHLEIDFWNELILKNLYIKDLNQDTLIYLRELDVAVSELDFLNQKIGISIHLTEPNAKTYVLKNDSVFNHQFLLDYFASSDTSSTNSDWEFKLNGIQISNGKYSFNDYNLDEEPYGVDYFHIVADSINLLAEGFDFKKDTVQFDLKQLSLKEQSGFDLDLLAAKAKIHKGVFDLKELNIITGETIIKGSYAMMANQFSDYVDYNNKVNMKGDLHSTVVNFKDLAYFVPQFLGIENEVFIEGKVEGTVANLRANDLQLKISGGTYLEGDFSFRGLPDIENTFIYTELSDLNTSAYALRSIPVPPFEEQKNLNIPASFNKLGQIKFKGNFTGYISDFVAFGSFSTALGNLQTDVLLKQNSKEQYEYSGNLSSTEFQLGQLVDEENLGGMALNVSITGKGFTKEDADFKTKGVVNYIEYSNYRYKNVKLNGSFKKEQFRGIINVKDENIVADFNGNIDLNKVKPISVFKLNVSKAKLAVLNLFNKEDLLTELSFQSEIDLKGTDIDDISGIAVVSNLKYRDRKLNHSVDEFSLTAGKKEGKRKIELESSFVDGKMEGDYQIADLKQTFRNVYHLFFDSTISPSLTSPQVFDFSAQFKDTKPITEVLLPDLSIAEGALIQLHFSTIDSIIDLEVSGKEVNYQRNNLKAFDLKLNAIKDSLQVNFKSEELQFADLESMAGVVFQSSLKNQKNNNRILIDTWGSKISQIDFNVSNNLENLLQMDFAFENSTFQVKNALWKINNNNRIQLDSGRFNIHNLDVGNDLQQLLISGKASDLVEDTLNVDLKEIDLEFVSSLLPENSVEMEGVANGTASLISVYKELSFTTDLKLDSLFVNNVEIGESNLKSTWNSEQKALIVDGNLGDANSDILRVTGSVFPLQKENSLDLSVNFNQFPLELIRPYLVEYITGIEGFINGKVAVKGEGDAPQLKGILGLNQSKFHVNYLNTSYHIDDQIIVEPDFIGFNLIKVKDSKGSPAIATGTIFHDNYSNFNYDIGLEFTNFFSLNTTAKDNELFYGKGYASGTANISGYGDQLILELDLKTEKGTDFKIPLEEGVDVSNSDFLVFTNSPDYNKEKAEEVDLSGIELNFDLEITPDAKLQIIFDEQVGDIIKAQGQGDLSMIINTIGDFNIFGQYLVEKGDYLFTLQNVINKRFEIAKGSSIYWDGDPYQAVLNMEAIYKLRAPLYDLFPNDSSDEYKRRTPVELALKLNDNLMSPSISFDISLPEASEQTKRELESVLYVNNNDVNPQEMNQQVFGLLVLNRFLPTSATGAADGGYNAGAQSLNNGYEFVSNQLSNWASRLSENFDVGVKYQPADELNSDQFDVSVSTQLFQDRLTFDGNVGFTGDNPDLQNQNSGFVGEFTAIYKLKDGRYRVKGFNRSVTNSLLQLNSPYTQGIGFFYREDFDTLGELWRKYFDKK